MQGSRQVAKPEIIWWRVEPGLDIGKVPAEKRNKGFTKNRHIRRLANRFRPRRITPFMASATSAYRSKMGTVPGRTQALRGDIFHAAIGQTRILQNAHTNRLRQAARDVQSRTSLKTHKQALHLAFRLAGAVFTAYAVELPPDLE